MTESLYINAGGRGTRLAGYLGAESEKGVPKALLPLNYNGETDSFDLLIDYHVRQALASNAFDSIAVHTGDQELVAEYLEKKYGEMINILSSSDLQGTGTDLIVAAKNNPDIIGDTVVVTNCDTAIDINFANLLHAHQIGGRAATFALTTRKGVPNYNAFFIGEDDRVLFNKESAPDTEPSQEIINHTAWQGSSTGVVALERSFIDGLRTNPNQSIYGNIVKKALDENELGAFSIGNAFMQDFGTEASYKTFIQPLQVLAFLARVINSR